jgi:hypothetical protein
LTAEKRLGWGKVFKLFWNAAACCRFGLADNLRLRKRMTGTFDVFGAAKAVASHRTPKEANHDL